jgi:Transglycosylase-like domain
MDRQTLVSAALIAGGGALAWWLTQKAGPGVYAPIDLETALGGQNAGAGGALDGSDVSSYLARLSAAEDPSGDLYAKNPYSSASGLYQFTKATWTALGGDWGPDPTQAFGGLTPSADEQTAMAAKLTAGNASILDRAGQAITDAALYAAHIFGPSRASQVLGADPSTPLADLVGSSTVAKNPALGSTVSSFLDYLARKVG